jgi:hypothetical protein
MRAEDLIDKAINSPPVKTSPSSIAPGKGNRICPNCRKPTASRSEICKQCGYRKSDGIDPELKAIRSLDQIASLGGLDAVKAKIALVKKINEETLTPLGGLEETERVVAAVEALVARLERVA